MFGIADDSNFSVFRFNLRTLTAERTHTDGDDWRGLPPDRQLHARSLELRPSPPPPGKLETAFLACFGEFVSLVIDHKINLDDPRFRGYKEITTLKGYVIDAAWGADRPSRGQVVVSAYDFRTFCVCTVRSVYSGSLCQDSTRHGAVSRVCKHVQLCRRNRKWRSLTLH